MNNKFTPLEAKIILAGLSEQEKVEIEHIEAVEAQGKRPIISSNYIAMIISEIRDKVNANTES